MEIVPKKSLGQNFLIDKNIQKKFIDNCKLKVTDIIFEIGAGTGLITQYLPDKVAEVLIIEKDKRCIDILREKFKDKKNIKIYHQDILEMDFKILPDNIKIIGNIPYQISSLIFKKIFENKEKIKQCFFILQLDFVKRLLAKKDTKDYSSLTLWAEYNAEIKQLFKIKANSFYPVPNIISAVVEMNLLNNKELNEEESKQLNQMIRKIFQQRRKTIRKILKEIYPNKDIEGIIKEINISQNDRPENISLRNYKKIIKKINNGEKE